MMTFGPLAFLSPWMLTALLALPVIWWLLRATPPRPQQIFFPPTRLMKELETKEQTPSHSPWWLTALRVLLAALIIGALARPILNPDQDVAISDGPIIVVLDNSWASAKKWRSHKSYMDTLIRRAEREARPIALVTTTKDGRVFPISLDAPSKIKERAASIVPLPYKPKRMETLDALKAELKDLNSPNIFWLSDGLDHGNAEDFAEGLKTLAGADGALTIVKSAGTSSALGLVAQPHASNDLKAKIVRAEGGAEKGIVLAWSARGDRLGETSFAFEAGETETEATFTLPLELRNTVARLEISGEQSAGGIYLLDARSQRQRIGLISGEAREQSQPLLSPLYYIEKALAPYSDLVASSDRNIATATQDLLSQNPSTLVLADIGKLVGETYDKIDGWVNKGGVLVRFAGPRLEKDGDELLPVALRQGGRTLGGALSWSTPQKLADFEEQSIFRGLTVPADVTVNRQVLADPGRSRADTEVWARLNDGTPLVTAAKRGEGWTVLFHVTANSDWSKLPHSGLFVEMLRRLTELSSASIAPTATEGGSQESAATATPGRIYAQTEMLPPFQTLDGFGRLSAPPPLAEPVKLSEIDKVRPSAQHPPGLYGPATSPRVINVITPKTVLSPISALPDGAATADYTASAPMTLKPWLLLAALALFCLDALAIMYLSGGLNFGGRRLKRASPFGAAMVLLAFGLTLFASPLLAQDKTAVSSEDAFALKAALKTRLAYVITGDTETDNTSHKGLDGLSRVIAARTAIEPGEPMGVNIDSDELAFFPIIYWPVQENAKPLAEKTLARLDAYMKQGGLLLFDTRDYQKTLHLGGTSSQGPGAIALQRLLGKLYHYIHGLSSRAIAPAFPAAQGREPGRLCSFLSVRTS